MYVRTVFDARGLWLRPGNHSYSDAIQSDFKSLTSLQALLRTSC